MVSDRTHDDTTSSREERTTSPRERGSDTARTRRVDGPNESAGTGSVFDRRRFLATAGLGVAVGVAGCVGSPIGGSDEGSNEIHPQFGFSGAADQEPPVDPDHEVKTMIKPREGAPIPQFFFEPTGMFVEPGDTVRFSLTTPDHTVTAYHPGFGRTQRVPDDVPPFSSPVLPGGAYWLYTFEREGVYDFLCAPHELFGMSGRIVVGSASGPGAEPLAPPPRGEGPRPPDLTARLVLSDPALAANRIVDEGQVGWSAIAPENKRLLIRIVEGGGEE